MRNSLAEAKVGEEGGGEVLQVPEPAACGEDHGEAGCPPAAHGVPRWSRVPRCSPRRRPRWSRGRERPRRSGGDKALQTDRSPHPPAPLSRLGGGGGRGWTGGGKSYRLPTLSLLCPSRYLLSELPVLISVLEPLASYFLSLSLSGGGVRERPWWNSAAHPSKNTTQ